MEQLLEETYRAEREHFWFKGFRQFIAPLVDQALAGRPAPRLLDCGCGTGTNLDLFRTRCDAFGFDLTPGGLRFARTHGGLRVARASITHVPFAHATLRRGHLVRRPAMRDRGAGDAGDGVDGAGAEAGRGADPERRRARVPERQP